MINLSEYAYAFLATYFLIIWTLFFVLRKDLRKKLLRLGTVGIFAGPASEIWYFSDYWNPPGIFGSSLFFEDIVAGFAIVGVSGSVYQVATRRALVKTHDKKLGQAIVMFVSGVFGLVVFANILGVNSIIASIALFLLFTVVVVLQRRDLLLAAVYSSVLISLAALLFYAVVFNFVASSFWDKHWLLNGTELGIFILGNVPLTEVVWYLSWSALAGVFYEYTLGHTHAELQWPKSAKIIDRINGSIH